MARKTAKKPEETERIKSTVKPKGPIKYKLELNEEQKEAKRLILNNQITIITGVAGTGKSLVSAITALDQLFKKEVEKILISRPVIEVGKTLGYLKGDQDEKVKPYIEPVYDNLEKCYDMDKIKSLIENRSLQIYPINFIRGKTVDDILIVEEAQNTTKEEMLAILTRLGKNGKIIINGDLAQCDLKNSTNGLAFAIELAKNIESIKMIDLVQNHRSGLVKEILDYVDKQNKKNNGTEEK